MGIDIVETEDNGGDVGEEEGDEEESLHLFVKEDNGIRGRGRLRCRGPVCFSISFWSWRLSFFLESAMVRSARRPGFRTGEILKWSLCFSILEGY